MKELKVRFKRLDNVVLMKVVQQDCSSIGSGTLFEHNGFKLQSAYYFEINNNELFVRGLDDSADNHVDYHKFKTPKQAKEYIKRAKECINAYNDSIRIKEVFDIEKYQGNYVMHCETEEQAREFCEYNFGRTTKFYKVDENGVCFNFNYGGYSNINYYRTHEFTILKFKDFTFAIKEKEDKPFPQIGYTYYFYEDCKIWHNKFNDGKKCEERLYNNNVWQTFKECERYNEIKQKEMELSHKFTREEWERPDIKKFIITYYFDLEREEILFYKQCNFGNTTFKTREDAQSFFDFCGKEDYLKYVLGVK